MKTQIENKVLIVFESELFRTTTTMVLGEEYVLLVDPNWLPREIASIKHCFDEHKKSRDAYLLFTHSDYDHIIAYGAFMEDVRQVIASDYMVNSTDKEKNLEEIHKFDESYYIKRNYPILYPEIDLPVCAEDKETSMLIGSDEYIFYPARGHNADGILTYNKTKGILITGDYMSNVEFPFVYHSFPAYKKTLDCLENILETQTVNLLICGHGDCTGDIVEMKNRLKDARQYIKELEYAVQNDMEISLDKLWERYDFPKGMLPFHEGNVALMKKEMGRK